MMVDDGCNGPSHVSELTHIENCTLVEAVIAQLIKNDALLSDLPVDVTLDEVKSLIAVEYGQSISLTVERAGLESVKIAVVNNSTVCDLRMAVQRQLARHIHRSGATEHLSWRQFWRNHCLMHKGVKLTDENMSIKEYGIQHKDTISFCKQRQSKLPVE